MSGGTSLDLGRRYVVRPAPVQAGARRPFEWYVLDRSYCHNVVARYGNEQAAQTRAAELERRTGP